MDGEGLNQAGASNPTGTPNLTGTPGLSPAGASPKAISRRRFIQMSLGAAAAVGLGAGFYTWQFEPTWLEMVARPMPVRGLPSNLEGARLVQLSDIHVGSQVSDEYLLETFKRVERLRPEIVVITGDLTTFYRDVIEHSESIYSHIPHGSMATVATLGNHDYGDQWSDLITAERLSGILRRSGVEVLRNQIHRVSGLQIVGMDDLWSRRFSPDEAFSGLIAERPMIALSHNPDTVDLPGWAGFQGWILSGHTHGGQIRPPFLPPFIVPVRNRRYTAGEFGLTGNRRLYISRGVGHLWKVRFNVRPEVTVFELRSA